MYYLISQVVKAGPVEKMAVMSAKPKEKTMQEGVRWEISNYVKESFAHTMSYVLMSMNLLQIRAHFTRHQWGADIRPHLRGTLTGPLSYQQPLKAKSHKSF